MNYFLQTAAKIIITPLLFVFGIAGYHVDKNVSPTPVAKIVQKDIMLGAVNYPTGGGTYRLASSISSSQTTIKLSSFKEPNSNIPYTMAYLNASLEYGTIDPQTSNSEFVSFSGITQNVDGTATITGVIRGLSRSYPYTASSTFQTTHSGQANFILSNPPQLYNDIYTYINNLSIAGSVDMSTSIKGIGEEATASEASTHKADGSGNTTAPLVLVASISSSSRTANTPLVVVSSSTDGYIDNSFINRAALFPVASVANGTTTFATTTLNVGAFPAYWIGKNTQIITSTGTSTISVPQGITKLFVRVQAGGGGGGTSSQSGSAGGGGGGGGYAEGFVNVTGTSTIQIYVSPGSVSSQTDGQWSTFGTNGFYMYATGGLKGANDSGDAGALGGRGGLGVGGDLNISGCDGGDGVSISATVAFSGFGGCSHFGGISRGGSPISNNASTPQNYGVGSGGGSNTGSPTNGVQGFVSISW